MEIEDKEQSKSKIANPKGMDFVLFGDTYHYKFTDFECLKDTYKASNDLLGEKYFKICYNALHKVKSSGGIENFQFKIYLTHPSIYFQVAEIYTMTILPVDIPLFFKSAESFIKAVIINEDNKIRLKYEANMTTKLIKTGNGNIDD